VPVDGDSQAPFPRHQDIFLRQPTLGTINHSFSNQHPRPMSEPDKPELINIMVTEANG